jgi:hypothetical protein
VGRSSSSVAGPNESEGPNLDVDHVRIGIQNSYPELFNIGGYSTVSNEIWILMFGATQQILTKFDFDRLCEWALHRHRIPNELERFSEEIGLII